ncbi:methyltransferase domain-containing protein [Nitratiruptor tergarcus]|uniref:Malonyl-CoA O-methyltransferase n=1 Tax=Nitratiruptor tergarcus DSM 16512 TaxID=1069081 RepID=A0A1W1WQT5_9BACT|nr:methyltransferase domain-containing protein [Nitratiruptor tergarcus]SMC08657.1 malonyl-CoA O-methyltransferase [Nitratiruptor tergarcus DSM 16512]
MKHIKEFDRFASAYQRQKIIQTKVAKYLVENSPFQGKYILDLGAGSGEVYRAITWDFEKFYALDLSAKMLSFHPTTKVEKIYCSFDSELCWQKLKKRKIDQVFASSSLQWSKDLDTVFMHLQNFPHLSAALFTNNTFRSIHEKLGIKSPIRPVKEVLDIAKKYFMVNYEIREYKLFFPDIKSAFFYIKKSGISSGEKRASVASLRQFMRTFDKNYLEFEVIFLWCEK